MLTSYCQRQLWVFALLGFWTSLLLGCSSKKPDPAEKKTTVVNAVDMAHIEQYQAQKFDCELPVSFMYLVDLNNNPARKKAVVAEVQNRLSAGQQILQNFEQALVGGCQTNENGSSAENSAGSINKDRVVLVNAQGQSYFSAGLDISSLHHQYDSAQGLDFVTLNLVISADFRSQTGASDIYVILSDLSLTDAYYNHGALIKAVPSWGPATDESVQRFGIVYKRLEYNQDYVLALHFAIRNYNFTPSSEYLLSFVFQDKRIQLSTRQH